MEALLLVLCTPLAGAGVLALFGHRERAAEVNIAFSLATLIAAAFLTAIVIADGPLLVLQEQFFVDSLNVFLVALTAFVAFTTALFARPYMRIERDLGKMTAPRMRLFHSMYQLFSFTMLLALLTNNMGLLWVAMEAATLATVLLVAVYRTPASLEAAWKYFILCGVGIAQALFGTILLYLAAERVVPVEGAGLLWTHLVAVKGDLEPTVIALSFVFLLVGYGTKVGLAPLHNWLPDAHAEGPTPISAVLSGLLLNVALYAVLRCKVLADGALETRFAGDLMMGFGLLSVVLAAFFLSRQRDIKRMFAYSSIEHMGLITFAFGMGGPIASFAGLLHMTVHSLVKSAIFFTVGHAAQKAGTQVMENIRGLIKVSPAVGWGLMIGTLAILGMPPFGVFASEFLILTTAMREYPWTTPLLLLSLGVAFAAVLRQGAADGLRRDLRQAARASAGADPGIRAPRPEPDARPVHPAVPRGLVPAGGPADCGRLTMRIDASDLDFRRLPGAAPAAIATVTETQWSALAATVREGGRFVAVWGSDRRATGEGFVVYAAYAVEDGLACACLPFAADRLEYPDLAAAFPSATRMQRALFDLLGVSAAGAEDQRPWLRHAAWPADFFPLRHDADPQRAFENEQERYAFVSVEGDGVHEIPVGPIHAGIIEPGHFRFSIVGEKVLRLEERLGYVHKGIERRFVGMPLADGQRLAGRVSGDSTVAYAWAYAMAAEAASDCAIPARAAWLRALLLERERVANHLGDLGALGNDGGLAFGLAQFSRLRELWQRSSAAVFGHRLLMDRIVPGGVAVDPSRASWRRSALSAANCATRSTGCDRSTTSMPDCRIGS